MTKQEIEKAIENGESVWYLFGKVYELKTSEHTNKFISRSDDYCYSDKKSVDRCAPLDMLYKSKGEAEHYLNHQDITRTEQLPFLTWEEFKNGKNLFFTNKSGYPICLCVVDTRLSKKIGLGGANGYFGLQQIWDLTEQNFYLAYDECVRLFRGE